MNKAVSTKVKIKQQAWQKYISPKSQENQHNNARARNQACWEPRKARKQFEKNIAMEAKTNPK